MAIAAQVKERSRPGPSRPDLAELKSRLEALQPEIGARAAATEKACRVPVR